MWGGRGAQKTSCLDKNFHLSHHADGIMHNRTFYAIIKRQGHLANIQYSDSQFIRKAWQKLGGRGVSKLVSNQQLLKRHGHLAFTTPCELTMNYHAYLELNLKMDPEYCKLAPGTFKRAGYSLRMTQRHCMVP